MNLDHQVTYREIIREEYAQRRGRNPRYSLRAFARDLDLSPSMLSDVMNGNHGLSRAGATKVARAMNLNRSESEFFCDLVDSVDARSTTKRETAKIRLQKHHKFSAFSRMEIDAFNFISDWYHVAILQMFDLKEFRDDPEWLAVQLGISRAEVETALARLERLGYVKTTPDGLRRLQGDLATVGNEAPSAAIRKFHEQVIDKAKSALFTQPIAEREFSSLALCIDQADLPRAKQMLRDFQMEFALEMSRTANKNSLYLLSLQLFQASNRRSP